MLDDHPQLRELKGIMNSEGDISDSGALDVIKKDHPNDNEYSNCCTEMLQYRPNTTWHQLAEALNNANTAARG